MNFKKMPLLFMFLLISFLSVFVNKNSAQALSKMQKSNMKRIAKYTADHYDKYGVLPSIAIAQAMQESGLGEVCPNYNLWGLASGKIYCCSVEDGCKKYLKCINNGYYKGAPFEKDWKKQISKILAGGYCQPVGNYYSCIVSIVNEYNLTKYDKKMWKDRKAKKEAKRRKKEQQEKKQKAKDNENEIATKSAISIATTQSVVYTDMVNIFDSKNLLLENINDTDNNQIITVDMFIESDKYKAAKIYDPYLIPLKTTNDKIKEIKFDQSGSFFYYLQNCNF